MSSDKIICIYPNRCQFPDCNCDKLQQPRRYGFSGNDFYNYASMSPIPEPEPESCPKTSPTPPTDEPSETKLNDSVLPLMFDYEGLRYRKIDGKWLVTGVGVVKPVDTNRPRYVFYVSGNGTWPTQTFVKNTENGFFEKYPHERTAATWIFVGTSGETRIERLS